MERNSFGNDCVAPIVRAARCNPEFRDVLLKVGDILSEKLLCGAPLELVLDEQEKYRYSPKLDIDQHPEDVQGVAHLLLKAAYDLRAAERGLDPSFPEVFAES